MAAEEKNLENKIKRWLKDHGCYYIKYWAGAIYTKSGVPDIIACVNGYFVAIEVKSNRGKVSKLQEYTLRTIRRSKGYSVVVFPKNWIYIQKQLEELL